jgi:hypothetical protein
MVKKCPSGHKPVIVPLRKDPIEHALIRNTIIIALYGKTVR